MAAHVQPGKRVAAKAAIASAALASARPAPGGGLFGPKKVAKSEIANMTSQMAIMARAGVDMSTALQSLARQSKHPRLKVVLANVHESVMSGHAVSEAMLQHAGVFNETYIASVAAGEASGRLPEVLSQLAALLRNELRLANSVRTMLAYPILLSFVSGTVLLALILFVLPKFAEIFADCEAPLPFITRVLIGLSGELRQRFWLWLPLLGAALFGFTAFRRSEAGRRWWDRWTLTAPVVSKVTQALLIGRVCRLLGIMLDSGVPLLDSMRLARAAVRNSLYAALFARLEDDVLNGRGLSSALLDSAFVPGAASEMVLTAEKTGSLGMVTQLIGEHFEEEGEARLKELVSYMEPVITIVMGLLVAVIVMSVMLPLFDLSQAAKG